MLFYAGKIRNERAEVKTFLYLLYVFSRGIGENIEQLHD